MDERLLRAAIAALALAQLAIGLGQVLAPGAFYDAVAPFGARNDHFLRDFGTFYLALGAALLVAVRRPRWRAPLLALGAGQYALHAINHLIDVGEADPAWVGPADLASLAAGAAVFGFLARSAAISRRA